ncbi:ankyrin repeat domain-containing protein 50 [Microdochium nivale]|nr:ankyrin repeat domain-containing protein 50 [Microdochium nivale]
MTSRARPIAEADWDAHREEITKLYCDQKWTQTRVAEFMSENRGFSATKYQYETHFKLWNLKKKHSKETWSALGRELRQTQLSASIRYHDRTIDSRRIKKALSRYKDQMQQGTSSALSPGFEIGDSTVILAPVLEQLYQARILSKHLTPSLMIFKWLCKSRTDGQQMTLTPAALSDTIADFALPSSATTTSALASVVDTSDHNQHMTHDDVNTIVHINKISPQAFFPMATLERWKASDDTIQSTLGACQQLSAVTGADEARLHLLIFALSNNMTHKIGFTSMRDVWQYFRNSLAPSNRKWLLQMMQDSYSKSVWWKLVQGAIEAGDANGCIDLIRSGRLNVDSIICFGSNGEQVTALELAVLLGMAAVLNALLSEGADPTRSGEYTKSCFKQKRWGPLCWALTPFPDKTTVDPWKDIARQPSAFVSAKALFATGYWTKELNGDQEWFGDPFGTSWSARPCCPTCAPNPVFTIAFTVVDIASGITPPFVTKSQKLLAEDILEILELVVPIRRSVGTTEYGDPAWVLPTCTSENLVHGWRHLALGYFITRGRHSSMAMEVCSCGMFVLQCVSSNVLSRRDPSLALSRQTTEVSDGETSSTLEALYSTLLNDPSLYWSSVLQITELRGGEIKDNEDHLLNMAIQANDKDMVCKLLELRQSSLNLHASVWEFTWNNDNARLLDLLLENALTPEAVYFPTVMVETKLDELLLRSLAVHGVQIYEEHLGSLITHAAVVGKREILQLCMDLSPLSISKVIFSAISLICENHPAEVSGDLINTLLHYRPKHTVISKTGLVVDAITSAVAHGFTNIARQLLLPDMNAYAFCPDQECACEYPKYETLLGKLIMNDQTPDAQITELLIRKFCEPRQVDRYVCLLDARDVMTPLRLAIKRGSLRLVQLLVLEFKADVNFTPCMGMRRTPLQQAAEDGRHEIAQWLINNGAQINGEINQYGGATALQLAAIGGYCGIMEILINGGAEIHAPGASVDGRTAIEGGAEHGRVDAVKLLLDSGLNISGPDEEKLLSAINLAMENGHVSVVELLEDYHGDALQPEVPLDAEFDVGQDLDNYM